MNIKYIKYIKNIKYLQKHIYAFIMEGQQMRNATFKIENETGYVEEETAKLKNS